MQKRDAFAAQMQKVVQDCTSEQEQEVRRAIRRKRLARLRAGCLLVLLVAGIVLTIVYRDPVAEKLTAAWSAVFPHSETTDKAESSSIPYVGAFSRAKDTIGHAQAAKDEREKFLDGVGTVKPAADRATDRVPDHAADRDH